MGELAKIDLGLCERRRQIDADAWAMERAAFMAALEAQEDEHRRHLFLGVSVGVGLSFLAACLLAVTL